MSKESNETILSWHEKAFPETTQEQQFKKLIEEVEEFHSAELSGEQRKELADVYIVSIVLYYRYSDDFGIDIFNALCNRLYASMEDLWPIIDEKMKINRARKWHFVNGVYRHEDEQ